MFQLLFLDFYREEKIVLFMIYSNFSKERQCLVILITQISTSGITLSNYNHVKLTKMNYFASHDGLSSNRSCK